MGRGQASTRYSCAPPDAVSTPVRWGAPWGLHGVPIALEAGTAPVAPAPAFFGVRGRGVQRQLLTLARPAPGVLHGGSHAGGAVGELERRRSIRWGVGGGARALDLWPP